VIGSRDVESGFVGSKDVWDVGLGMPGQGLSVRGCWVSGCRARG
jgi:hypothetical protein